MKAYNFLGWWKAEGQGAEKQDWILVYISGQAASLVIRLPTAASWSVPEACEDAFKSRNYNCHLVSQDKTEQHNYKGQEWIK